MPELRKAASTTSVLAEHLEIPQEHSSLETTHNLFGFWRFAFPGTKYINIKSSFFAADMEYTPGTAGDPGGRDRSLAVVIINHYLLLTLLLCDVVFGLFFRRFFCFLRPAFGHSRLGHPQSLEYCGLIPTLSLLENMHTYRCNSVVVVVVVFISFNIKHFYK